MNLLGKKSISSREVAEMMEVSEHSKMLRKIDSINEILTKAKCGLSDYWYESSYKDSTGRKLREYQVTKKGCELIAHKTEGEKGVLFTVKYMERFERMEQVISKPKSAMELIELELQALKEINSKVDEVDKDLQSFKNDMPLMAVDTDRITTAKNIKAVELLGGKQSNAYKDKSVRTKVYRDMEAQIWRQFGVRTYKSIKRNQCDLAVDIINRYELPLILREEIADCNAQMTMKQM